MPYLCMRASSTVRSPLKLIGTGSNLCVYTGLTSFGVRLTLNCVFIQISSRWRAKMSFNSTIVSSKLSQSFPVISESVNLNTERNLLRDSSFGSKFSNWACSRNSFMILFWMSECSSSFPGFSGVGKQNFSSLFSGCSTYISALMYITTSSCSVRRLSTAMLNGGSFSFPPVSGFAVQLPWCLQLLYKESPLCWRSLLPLFCLWQLLLPGL